MALDNLSFSKLKEIEKTPEAGTSHSPDVGHINYPKSGHKT
jgi:hypothetical protein